MASNAEDQKQHLAATAHDQSSIVWDESLLTNSFDHQLKLVEQPNSKSTEEQQTNANQTTQSAGKKKKKHQQRDDQLTAQFINSSKIYKFDAQSDHNYSDDMKNRQTPGKETSPKTIHGTANSSASSVKLIPPPPFVGNLAIPDNLDEAQSSMLMAWYVAGYHTGYYEAAKKFDDNRQQRK